MAKVTGGSPSDTVLSKALPACDGQLIRPAFASARHTVTSAPATDPLTAVSRVGTAPTKSTVTQIL